MRRFERVVAVLDPSIKTLIVTGYENDPSQKPLDQHDASAIKRFVEGGGRFVAIDSDFAGRNDITPGVGTSHPAKGATAIALARNAFTAGVTRVRGPLSSVFPFSSARGVPLLANDRGMVAVSYRFGRGEVVAITAPELFGNRHLRDADNLRFAYNAIANHGVAAFDEYVHGYDDGLTMWGALPQPVRAAFWIVVAIVVLALIGANVRSAPPSPAGAARRARLGFVYCSNGGVDAPFAPAPGRRRRAARGSSRLPTAKGARVNSNVAEIAGRLSAGMDRVLVGADRVTTGLTIALLARGHVLIEGVPGTGKTLAVRMLALLLGLQFRRIAFTPDLMPSDVVGTTVFNPQTAQFSTRTGPIVANVVLADEVNRTPPKTQSALLEAMEEGRVTIDGVSYPLPQPFLLCATQNPIEYEGTYPLPEAQLDRFTVKVESSYPQEAQELELLARAAAGFDARALESSDIAPVTNAAEVIDAQQSVRRVHLSDAVRDYTYRIVAATRANPRLTLGASPRAGIGLLASSQAAAAIAGREFVTPDDVKDVAPLVIPHRLIVAPDAEIEGISARDVVGEILAALPVPRE